MTCLDLNANFDTVNHNIAEIFKNYYEPEYSVFNLIKVYFIDRPFSVIIGSFESDLQTINYSVPQGSILGPT